MAVKKFKGVVVPMVTPLKVSGEIDATAVGKLMAGFAEHGISPLVLGTTGESASLSERESAEVLEEAISKKSTHQQVYAGIVHNEVAQQVGLGRKYLELGADAVVATLPAYYPLTPSQMESHFKTFADAIGGPLLIYNIKATTRMSIPLSIIEALSQHPNIYGLKDSERDMERMSSAISLFRGREDFSYFCGWGAASVESFSLGADGIVPSTGNVVPEYYGKMLATVGEGDWELAKQMQTKTDQVAEIYQGGLTLGQSLAALKVLLELKGICFPHMKPPLTELPYELAQQIKSKWINYWAMQPQ